MILIVMGVTGAGKSTIAEHLNARLGWAYQEGDALHSAANVAKMHAGEPLTDADRAPWLDSIRAWIDARLEAGENGMVTCSALKRAYRDKLVAGRASVRILYLHAARAVLEAHLEHRHGHFMPSSLLQSQLDTLEPPAPDEHPIVVEVCAGVDDTVAEILTALRREDVAGV